MTMINAIDGHLYIGYDQYHTLDCGIVQSVSDNIPVSISQTPIPTYSAEAAFTFDLGATNPISFTLKRVNPQNAWDPLDHGTLDEAILSGSWIINDAPMDTWCNRLWVKALEKLVNRWQMKTDGCRLTFLPVVPGDTYQHGYNNINVYIKTLSYKYLVDYPDTLNVSISVVVGTMSGQRQAVV